MHVLASKIEKGSQADIILRDFAKACDDVLHQRLLHKLNYYGIDTITRSLIQSFIKKNRQQRVILEGTISERATVISDVPKGTVPGPMLFITCRNDMPETASFSETK